MHLVLANDIISIQDTVHSELLAPLKRSPVTDTSKERYREQLPVEMKAKSAPIPFKITRSNSETQLQQDEEAADYADYCMYVRIINGMARNKDPNSPMDPSVANVIITRHSCDRTSDGNGKNEYDCSSSPGRSRCPSPFREGVDGNPSTTAFQSESLDEEIFEMEL
jgi:hypothetical protein